MEQKKEIYRLIRIAGILSYIPLILVTGPFVGYMIGEYLEKKMGFSSYLPLVLAALGFISSVIEMVRILKQVLGVKRSG
jgi:hypothetical protein